jgi:hypothetical protein
MSSTHSVSSSLKNQSLVSRDLSDTDDLNPLFKVAAQNKRWTYLISNSIDFKRKQCPAIHLSKPDDDMVGIWLEKLLMAGQAGIIIVENLELDEITQCRIQKLCDEKQAIVINVKVKSAHYGNLVFGPW